jgi:putative membrane protein
MAPLSLGAAKSFCAHYIVPGRTALILPHTQGACMKYLILCLKGMAYGITHIVPGLGGGIVLILLGIYEQFVDAVGNILVERSRWREFLSFLIPLGIGMVMGMVLLAKLLTILLAGYSTETMIFFMGLLVGTIPAILRIHHDMRPTAGRIVALLCGVTLVIATRLLGSGAETETSSHSLAGFGGLAYNALVSFLAGGASVTPGLDGSYVLLLGGTYPNVLNAVAALTHMEIQWGILLTTAIGAVLGIVICAKLIDLAIRRVPGVTYYVVLGLVTGSVYGLWPQQPATLSPAVLALLFVVGGVLAYLGSREPASTKESTTVASAE